MLFFPIFLNNVPIKTEAFALIGCYATYVGSLLPTFRDILSALSPRVKPSKVFLFCGGGSVATHFSESATASSWTLQGCWDSTSHLVVERVLFFVLFLCIYVVFMYFCLCYNCTRAVEPERKLIMNDQLNYHHIYHNYYHYHQCHPVNGHWPVETARK